MNDHDSSKYNRQLDETRHAWDAEAASFDDAPDHGLRDGVIRAAWTRLLSASLPPARSAVLDIGCGTGSLSLVLAELRYDVTGVDVSPEMIAHAKAKAAAANQSIAFHVMDAAFPAFPPEQFDAMVCRHLLWALPQPDQVLERWVRLLKPDGRLLLIEGFWHTNVGLHAQDILDMLPASLTNPTVHSLSDQPELWGAPMHDERYALTADVRLPTT